MGNLTISEKSEKDLHNTTERERRKICKQACFELFPLAGKDASFFTKKRKCTNILFVDNPNPFLKIAIANQVNLLLASRVITYCILVLNACFKLIVNVILSQFQSP